MRCGSESKGTAPPLSSLPNLGRRGNPRDRSVLLCNNLWGTLTLSIILPVVIIGIIFSENVLDIVVVTNRFLLPFFPLLLELRENRIFLIIHSHAPPSIY